MSTAQLYTKVSGEGEVAGDVYVCLPCILGDGLFLVMEGTRNFPRTPPGWCPPPQPLIASPVGTGRLWEPGRVSSPRGVSGPSRYFTLPLSRFCGGKGELRPLASSFVGSVTRAAEHAAKTRPASPNPHRIFFFFFFPSHIPKTPGWREREKKPQTTKNPSPYNCCN